MRKLLGETNQLVTGARANAKNPSLGGQIGKDRAHEQVQRVAHGSQPGESLIVCGSVFTAERDWWFLALHRGSLQRMVGQRVQGTPGFSLRFCATILCLHRLTFLPVWLDIVGGDGEMIVVNHFKDGFPLP